MFDLIIIDGKKYTAEALMEAIEDMRQCYHSLNRGNKQTLAERDQIVDKMRRYTMIAAELGISENIRTSAH
jgi:hypothetical protein